jgi:hypothetical protein
MTTTTFATGTVIAASWLNDVDALTYEGAATYSDGSVSHVGGLAGNVWLWTRTMSGTIAVGADPTLSGYSPSSYMFDVTADTADVGTDFMIAHRVRHIFGGTATKGARIAQYVQSYQTAATSTTNLFKNFVAHQASMYANFSEGGTNTGAGAKGSFFGGGSALYVAAAATNLYATTMHEFNSFITAGSSMRYNLGVAIAGANAVRGTDYDCALSISGLTDTITHAGWKTGILFSAVNGAEPFYASSTLIQTASTGTISRGIDFSTHTITNEIIKGAYSSLSENTLYLGDTAGNSTIAVNGASTNANLLLYSKGTGSVYLKSSAGASLLRVDAVASAVNYLAVVPTVTTGTPTIAAQGSDTNIAIAFANQGTAITKFTGQTVGTTVGAAGGASALPATPLGYLSISLNGLGTVKIPYYN